MATNLVHNKSSGSLLPMDNLMLPWAEAVLQVKDEMEGGYMDAQRKEQVSMRKQVTTTTTYEASHARAPPSPPSHSSQLMDNLSHHKLRVDFIVASKFVNDRREKIVMEIRKPGAGNADKVSKLLSELHNLRAEVAKYRGEAISFHDHTVSESALEVRGVEERT